MRTSNSKERQKYSQTQQQKTQPSIQNKIPVTPEQYSRHPSRKQQRKILPPRPVSKITYEIKDNMTESKVIVAKQGLQLLKKKMNRTGMSRQKSHSQTEKIDENDNHPLAIKKLPGKTQPISEKEISFKKGKDSSVKLQKPDVPIQASRPPKEPLRSKQMNSDNGDIAEDDRPISKQVDFMQLLQREMSKEEKVEAKGKASFAREKNKIYNQKGEEIILHQCTMGCGRMFNPQTIEKHERICQKVFQSKRKAFNSASHRQIEGQTYQTTTAPLSKIEEKPKPKNAIPKWKIESARLRVGLKQAKNIPVSKQQQKMMQNEADSLKGCPCCGRKFNQQAAKKHIPFCQRKAKQMQNKTVGGKKR